MNSKLTSREIRGYEQAMAAPTWATQPPQARAQMQQGFQKKLHQVPHNLAGSLDSLTAITEMMADQTICKVLPGSPSQSPPSTRLSIPKSPPHPFPSYAHATFFFSPYLQP